MSKGWRGAKHFGAKKQLRAVRGSDMCSPYFGTGCGCRGRWGGSHGIGTHPACVVFRPWWIKNRSL